MPRSVTMRPFCMEPNWPVAVAWIHSMDTESCNPYDHWSFPVCVPVSSLPTGVRSVLGWVRDYLLLKHPSWDVEIKTELNHRIGDTSELVEHIPVGGII